MVYSKFWIRIFPVVNADAVLHEYRTNSDDITKGLLTQCGCDFVIAKCSHGVIASTTLNPIKPISFEK